MYKYIFKTPNEDFNTDDYTLKIINLILRCNLSNDNKQIIKSFFILLSESYRVFVATLLFIFAPQKCENQIDKVCTINDNFYNLTPYDIGVLTCNFITLASFISLYIIEYHRESWCI